VRKEPNSKNKNELAIKNRKILTENHLILGMPAVLFMIGVCVPVVSFIVFRSFIAAVFLGAAFFAPMLAIHKNDPKGLKVWIACIMDSTSRWSAGSRSRIDLVIK
jgi:type IV secretory pathway VirB3-like protein